MDNSKNKSKSAVKIILPVFLILIVCLLLGVASLPSLISTQWGNEKVSQFINSHISGKVTFKNLQMSWFQGQKIEDVKLYDSEGKQIASLISADAQIPLWNLFISREKEGSFNLEGLNADIVKQADGTINLQTALIPSHESFSEKNNSPLVISLREVNASGTLEKNRKSHLQLSGKTTQGELQGAFNLKALIDDINKDSFFADKHRLNTDQIGKITIQANANNFPVSLLDEALSLSDPRYKGLVLAALGNKLDLNLQESKGTDGIDLKLQINTPLVHGVLNGLLKEDRLVVNEPDSIEITLQPEFVRLLTKVFSTNYQVQLKKAVQGQFNLSKLNLIFDFQGKKFIDFAQSTVLASFKVDRADLQISQPIGDISLQKLNILLDAPENNDKITVTLDSQASRQQATTQIRLKSQLNKDFKEDFSSLKNAEIDFDLKGLPIGLFDEILGESNLLVDALGKSVDAQASFVYHDKPSLTVKFQSDVFKMDTLDLEISPYLTLKRPVKIEYILPSSLINNLALKNSRLQMLDKTLVQVSLNKMAIPILSKESDLSKWILSADLNIGAINLQNSSNQEIVQFASVSASINGSSLADSHANFKAKVFSSDESSLYHLLGKETSFNFDTQLALVQEGLNFKGEITSDRAHAKLDGRLEKFERIHLNSPAEIDYHLNPKAIQILGLNNLNLENTSQIHMHLDVDRKGIHIFDLSTLKLNGLIKIDQINLYGNAGALKQVVIPLEVSAPQNKIALHMNGITKLSGNEEGSLDGNIQIYQWLTNKEIDFTNAKLESHLTVINFPVSFVEKISAQEDLMAMMGRSLNIDLTANLTHLKNPLGSIKLVVDGKDLLAEGSFSLENGQLINKGPAKAQIILTPERFQAFRKRLLTPGKKHPEIILTEPSQIVLDIHSLSLPLESNDPLWLKASLNSQLKVDKLSIKNKENGHQVWLKDIQGLIESPEIAKNIAFSLNGQHNQEGGSPLPFSINGRADHAFKSSGEIDTNSLALWLDTKFQKFPVMLLGQFLNVNDKISHRISAILGSKINADIHIQIDHLQGPVIANLSGNNGKISLDAKINNGFLTLNKNFNSQVLLTQEFGSVVLDDLFPLANGLVGSDNPLTINIDAAGFSMPIKDFDIAAVQVGSASLELGKVRFRSDGKLGTILSLFNTSGSDLISVWFTPLYISMQNGAVKFQRMDMLIMDTYPIATWGTVDLLNDKVNMMIGLTGQALVKGFNIPSLGKEYMLQIPFKGTISNASIDKKKATAKIGALVASNRGPEGLLIGTALHIASGGLTEEKAPAPTTSPLPWSTGDDASIPGSSKHDVNHPLHQVEDKATSLLRNFINF